MEAELAALIKAIIAGELRLIQQAPSLLLVILSQKGVPGAQNN